MFQCFFEGYQALELNLDYHCHWHWEFGIIGSFKGERLKALKNLYERAKKFHMKPIKKIVGTWQILELSIKSPSLHPLFNPLSPLLSSPIPSLNGIHKVMKFLLNRSMKCWKSAFNAQGSESKYSSCTGRSSENICSSSGGAHEKGKTA
jgi:hypothetical protein